MDDSVRARKSLVAPPFQPHRYEGWGSKADKCPRTLLPCLPAGSNKRWCRVGMRLRGNLWAKRTAVVDTREPSQNPIHYTAVTPEPPPSTNQISSVSRLCPRSYSFPCCMTVKGSKHVAMLDQPVAHCNSIIIMMTLLLQPALTFILKFLRSASSASRSNRSYISSAVSDNPFTKTSPPVNFAKSAGCGFSLSLVSHHLPL